MAARAKEKAKRVVGTSEVLAALPMLRKRHRNEDLLYSGIYYILKIRYPSQRLSFLFRIAQSLVKPSKAQAMGLLPPVQLLELLEHRMASQSLLSPGH